MDPFHPAAQDCSGEILGKEQVTSAPYREQRAGQQRITHGLPQFVNTIIFNKTAALHLHPESVHAAEIDVETCSHIHKYM